MTSVFLSYAGGDDDSFVAGLYKFLRSRNFDVWWDRECMPSRSLTFTEEIRDAIHRSDRLVVVIGPHALCSDYVRAEWQAALSEHKAVVPILRRVPEGIQDVHSCLPAELKDFHAPNFIADGGKEPPLSSLERILLEPIPPPAPIFGRPPERPAHFRPRPSKFEEVFRAVLGEVTSARVLTNEQRVTVLTGMGGIGKTVLAVNLVEAMRSRPSTFLKDGIYWLSGENSLRRLGVLCGAPTHELFEEQAITDAIADRLHGKRFLLLIDDAKYVDQIAPLVRVLGAGGRMLVTTRNGDLAVGHQHVQLDKLTEVDALQLVADWLDTSIDKLPREAWRVVELCGFHPFAIAINAAAARQGLALSTICAALEQHELGYVQHRFEEYVYATVEQSIETSVNALSEANQGCYRDLAAFFWEKGVPAPAIAHFWQWRSGLSAHHAERLLVFLRQRSLVQLAGAPERYEVRLHDLHRAYIKRDQNAVKAISGALLESYQPSQRDAWWNVTDDGYFPSGVVPHLIQSRPTTELLTLLSAEDAKQRNRWYLRRVYAASAVRADADDDGFAGYVSDLQLASDVVSDCLLPLTMASLRSLVRTTPGPLIASAVHYGIWSLDRAVASVRLISESEKRARAMTALLPMVKDRDVWINETLDAIAISETTAREELTHALASVAAPSDLLTILGRIVEWIQNASTRYEERWTRPIVWPLLGRIPKELAAEALEIVAEISIEPLYLTLELLEEPERSARIREVLESTKDEGNMAIYARTARELAKYFDATAAASLVAEALTLVRELGPDMPRNDGLFYLLPSIARDEQHDVLEELIVDAIANRRKFSTLVQQAPPELHTRIREVLETQKDAWIVEATPAFTGEHREKLAERSLSAIERQEGWTSDLWMDDGRFILALNQEQLTRARRLIDARLNGWEKVNALIAVAQATTPEHRAQVIDEVLREIDALSDADKREMAYRKVSPLLVLSQMTAALVAAERIGEPSGIPEIPKMLPHLSASVRERAIELFVRFAISAPFWEWRNALRLVPRGLESVALDAMLDLVPRLNSNQGAHLLVMLASRVTKEKRQRTTHDALVAIGQSPDDTIRVELMLELGDVRGAERKLKDSLSDLRPDDLAKLIAKLASRLPPDERGYWVRAALDKGAPTTDVRHLVETLAPLLAPEQARTYLARLIMCMDPEGRGELIRAQDFSLPSILIGDKPSTAAALARRLGALGLAGETFELLCIGTSDDITTVALVELVPYLARDKVLYVEQRALNAGPIEGTFPIDDGVRVGAGRDYFAARLAPSLMRLGETDRALNYARAAKSDEWSVPTYLGIAEIASGKTRTDTLLEALDCLLALRSGYRRAQISDVTRAIALDNDAAPSAWSMAIEWARTHPRHEAVEVLASFSPVAARIGGTALTDEVFSGIERVLRWWP